MQRLTFRGSSGTVDVGNFPRRADFLALLAASAAKATILESTDTQVKRRKTMALADIAPQLQALPLSERRKALAMLLALESEERRAHAQRMAGKIDDNTPANWVDLDDLDKRLGLAEDSE